MGLEGIRYEKSERGDLFRAIFAQEPHFQGIWLVAPDGRLLVFTLGGTNHKDRTKKLIADLKDGLKKFGPITPRRVFPTNLTPYRGIGARADGSVTLAVSDKAINVRYLSQLPHNSSLQMFVDNVTLSRDEWSALAPPDVREGAEWKIPEAVGRQFFPLFNPFDVKFRRADEVTGRPVDRAASLPYATALPTWHTAVASRWTHHGTKQETVEGRACSSELTMIGGAGAYDIRTGQMLSLKWVWDGLTWFWYYENSSDRPAPARFGAVVEWRQGSPKGAAQPEASAAGPSVNVEPVDSTPDAALRTFLLALAARDEAALRAVALPDAELNVLLEGPKAAPDQLAISKARLEMKPFRRLKAGDPVRVPNGETLVIKPDDVRDGRVVLWPDGAPLPSRLQNVDGHWKVFARPFITAAKSVLKNSQTAQPNSVDHPRAPGH